MIPINGKPIIEHIMEIYSKYGFKDFYLALGYKANVIKEYFYNYEILNSNFKVDFKNRSVTPYKKQEKDWTVNLIDTGENTMTGGRLKRLKDYIKDDTFLLTYGDAVTNLDINEVIKFHYSHGKMITVTGVRPPARFGELTINENNEVLEFKEKPNTNEGWINGGFFVIEPDIFKILSNGDYLGVTPDGPRGPNQKVSDGIIKIAINSQVPILPIGFASSKNFNLKSWDSFLITYPFSKCKFIWGDPIIIPSNTTDVEIVKYRLFLEKKINYCMDTAKLKLDA